jgi:hypothetical protein
MPKTLLKTWHLLHVFELAKEWTDTITYARGLPRWIVPPLLPSWHRIESINKPPNYHHDFSDNTSNLRLTNPQTEAPTILLAYCTRTGCRSDSTYSNHKRPVGDDDQKANLLITLPGYVFMVQTK